MDFKSLNLDKRYYEIYKTLSASAKVSFVFDLISTGLFDFEVSFDDQPDETESLEFNLIELPDDEEIIVSILELDDNIFLINGDSVESVSALITSLTSQGTVLRKIEEFNVDKFKDSLEGPLNYVVAYKALGVTSPLSLN